MSKEVKRNKIYRKIWSDAYGKIPKDSKGRSYEIHHINGDHYDDRLENLKLVTIDEHYQIHYQQKDYYACHMMLRRMRISPEENSRISSELATLSNMERMRNGTHHFITNHPNKDGRLTRKSLEKGTHNFIANNPTKERIKNGTHHFVTNHPGKKQMENGTHRFQTNNPTKGRMENGSHNFLIDNPSKVVYVDVETGKVMSKSHFKRWHPDRLPFIVKL